MPYLFASILPIDGRREPPYASSLPQPLTLLPPPPPRPPAALPPPALVLLLPPPPPPPPDPLVDLCFDRLHPNLSCGILFSTLPLSPPPLPSLRSFLAPLAPDVRDINILTSQHSVRGSRWYFPYGYGRGLPGLTLTPRRRPTTTV